MNPQAPANNNAAPEVVTSSTAPVVREFPSAYADGRQAVKNLAWLKCRPRFLCWALIPQEDGAVKKIPYNPTTGRNASCDDPTTWVDFETAKAAVLAGQYHSIGIALGKDLGLTIVDFDKIIAKLGDPWPSWVLNIVEDLDSYTEISASGRGLHVLAWGAVPSNLNRQKPQIEIHDSDKMFAISTNFFEGRREIHERDEKLQTLHQRILEGKVGPSIIAHNPSVERLAWLEAGNDDGDKSKGDFEYVRLLMEQGLTEDEIDARFRASERMRDKWEDRADYRERTFAAARQKAVTAPAAPKQRLRLVNFARIQTKPINWLWPGKMAIGHITTLNGDPGTKKSFISLDIAARISTGRPMPDGLPNPFPPSSVLVLTREDGLEDTVKPRFQAAGGNPSKLDSVATEGSQETCVLKIEEHLAELEEIMQPDTRVIIFDPLIDFLKAQQNHEAEVRDVLTKLKQFAERRELSIIGINHLNKKSDLDAIHRTMGAKGFIGVARMNFLVGKDEGGNLHLCSLKNNLWADDGSLTFKLEDSVVEDGHVTVTQVGRVVWTGKGQLTADEITVPKGKAAQNRAADWLKGYLQPTGTKKPAKEIYADGLQEGFSEDQLKRTLGKIAEHEREQRQGAGTVGWLPISEAGF